MRLLLRRTAAWAALFCANPRAFFYALAHPDSPRGRTLRKLLRGKE